MAASEHTPQLNLSQFGPDDRPSWIDDYNADMRNIEQVIAMAFTKLAPKPILYCTAKVSQGSNFTASTETPYKSVFSMSNGNIYLDHDANTIPITESGYYVVSGYAEVNGVTLDTGDDKSLQLEINSSNGYGDENIITSVFNKSYDHSEPTDYGMVQSCSITPIIVQLIAGDKVTMNISPRSNATIHGNIGTMYITLESKMLDGNAS